MLRKSNKPTRDEALSLLETTRRQESILSVALNYLAAGGPPDARTVITEGQDRYELRAYGLDRADGGILVVTFHHPGQRPYSSAHYLDDYRASMRRALAAGIERDWRMFEALNGFCGLRDRANMPPTPAEALVQATGSRGWPKEGA